MCIHVSSANSLPTSLFVQRIGRSPFPRLASLLDRCHCCPRLARHPAAVAEPSVSTFATVRRRSTIAAANGGVRVRTGQDAVVAVPEQPLLVSIALSDLPRRDTPGLEGAWLRGGGPLEATERWRWSTVQGCAQATANAATAGSQLAWVASGLRDGRRAGCGRAWRRQTQPHLVGWRGRNWKRNCLTRRLSTMPYMCPRAGGHTT